MMKKSYQEIKQYNLFKRISIIGGKLNNRKLLILNNPNLRPTTMRIRKILFSWLSSIIYGSICLDCFAGSGMLGIEAISYGAKKVILIESNYEFGKQLVKNILNLKLNTVQVFIADSLQWMIHSSASFDIVFIDPPFYKNLIPETINRLEKYNKLSKQSWIYIQSEIKQQAFSIPVYWNLHRKKITNNTKHFLYVRHGILKDKLKY